MNTPGTFSRDSFALIPSLNSPQNDEARRAALLNRLEGIISSAERERRDFTPEEDKERQALTRDIRRIDVMLDVKAGLLDLDGIQTDNPHGSAIYSAFDTTGRAGGGRGRGRLAPGVPFARYVGAIALSRGNITAAAEFAQRWTDSPEVPRVLRAAVSAGTTTDQAWAGSLVAYRQMADEFIELLVPQTIIGQMPLRSVPFNTRIPRALSGATAGWVGERNPKPVSKAALDAITIPYNKLAVISVLTEELVRFSNPNAELLVRDLLIQAISDAMNASFIDALPATANVRPAGIVNGVVVGGPVAMTAAAIRDEAVVMIGAAIAGNFPVNRLRWILSPQLVLKLGAMRTVNGAAEFDGLPGSFMGVPVVQSTTVPYGATTNMILADAGSILLADDGQVTVDVSREAAVEMSDTPTGAGALVSLWQTNSVGILCERYITWQVARAGAVQVSAVTVA